MRGRKKTAPATTQLARWLVAARAQFVDPVSGLRGLSQRSLAARAGVSAARIAQVEAGASTSRGFISAVARALGRDEGEALRAGGYLPSASEVTIGGDSSRSTVAAYNNAPPDVQRLYDALEDAQRRILDPFVPRDLGDVERRIAQAARDAADRPDEEAANG